MPFVKDITQHNLRDHPLYPFYRVIFDREPDFPGFVWLCEKFNELVEAGSRAPMGELLPAYERHPEARRVGYPALVPVPRWEPDPEPGDPLEPWPAIDDPELIEGGAGRPAGGPEPAPAPTPAGDPVEPPSGPASAPPAPGPGMWTPAHLAHLRDGVDYLRLSQGGAIIRGTVFTDKALGALYDTYVSEFHFDANDGYALTALPILSTPGMTSPVAMTPAQFLRSFVCAYPEVDTTWRGVGRWNQDWAYRVHSRKGNEVQGIARTPEGGAKPLRQQAEDFWWFWVQDGVDPREVFKALT